VRILFDQGTPAPLHEALTQHEVSTTYERGWLKLRNGELLDAAEREGFALMVTTDSNLRYQSRKPAYYNRRSVVDQLASDTAVDRCRSWRD
jgi:hypothetical protein